MNHPAATGDDERSDDPPAPPSWIPRAALSVAVVILGVLATLWLAGRLRGLIFMVFISLFISIALEPAVQYLADRGWKRGLATGLVFIAAFLLTAGFIAALVPLFVTQAIDLANNLPGYVESLQGQLDEWGFEIQLFGDEALAQLDDVGSYLSTYGTTLAGGVFAVGNTVFGAFGRLTIIGLFTFYMVAEGPKLRRTVLSFLPPRPQREVLRVWAVAVEKTGGYIYSRLILAVVSAVYSAVVFMVLGIPSPIALGIWVGVLSQFIPVIGTYIAAILPALIGLTESLGTAIWVAVALVAYQQIENLLIGPRITARTMAIHPAVSVAAVVAGASLMGAVGIILALPVAAIVQAFISTYLERHEVIADLDEEMEGIDDA